MGAAVEFADILAKEVSTSDFIPYTSQITDNVIKLNSGDYLLALRLQGAAHESADARNIASWHTQLNGFLRNISSPQVAVWSHIVRRRYNEYPAGDFAPGFCKDLNDKYREHIEAKETLINELYITLVFRPQPIAGARLLTRLTGKSPQDLIDATNDDLEFMADLANTALASLERYEPELLGCYDFKGNKFSEVLEFLSFLVDGEWKRFPLPRAEIRDILCAVRPFFGKGGLMALKGPVGTHYAAILAIQEYPAITYPGILNDMLSANFELVVSQSLTFLSKPVAVSRMVMQQGRMVNAGDHAKSQIEDISLALDDLTSNEFVMGAHSMTVLVRADDPKALNKNISATGTMLSDSGMKWAREEAGIAAAYWSQLPGNFAYRVRVGDITSRNFAGFSSFHNFPIGHIRHNQWGHAVTVFTTTSGAPYFFNFHKGESGAEAQRLARLDPEHKDLANFVCIGQSGAGKTVLEMFFLAQLQKFSEPSKGRRLSCVVFDKDLGGSIAVRAMGGRYYALKNGKRSGFNPLQMDPTEFNLSFLETLVRRLVDHPSYPITPKQERDISNGIRGVMGTPKPKRRLSAILEFLDPTEENGIHMRLSRWCAGGTLSWLFDNAEDTLRMDEVNIVGFDVTEFLDNEETRGPTILYLFHRIQGLIDGRRIPILMDEFPKLLRDADFGELIRDKLVTIRKQDGFLGMFAQFPRQILDNPLAAGIVSQTATQIFLPNPLADEADYMGGFKLTRREFEIIRDLPLKSRKCLVKQGQNSVVVILDLHGFKDELAVMSGNTATSALADEVIRELGEDPAVWLPRFQQLRKERLA
jgi:type IV secretion system protein VirB4